MKYIFIILVTILTANISFAKEMDVGTCKNFEEHLKGCKPINCSFKLPYSSVAATVQLLIIGEKNGRCYYRQFAQFQSSTITYAVQMKYDCILSEAGKEKILKNFQAYKAGDDSTYRTNPREDILRSECKVRD
jgi:hypothetical protein